jgi:hypothetical protein
MKQFIRLKLINLRNDRHFQFGVEFIALMGLFAAVMAKVQTLFNAFVALHEQEDTALKKITKSALTKKMKNIDKERDAIFRGMVDVVKSALRHFNSEVVDAAERLKIILDTYGNVVYKSFDEETAALYNLLKDLIEKGAADIVTVGLTDWIEKLQTLNNTYQEMSRERFHEVSQRSPLVLKNVRQEADNTYRAIVEHIEALMLTEGSATYEPFVIELNTIIDKYNTILAQQQGQAAATREKAAAAAAQAEAAAQADTETKIDPEIEAFVKEAETPKK